MMRANKERPLMEIPHEAALLRIFIGESDRHEHRPLYEAIIPESAPDAPRRRNDEKSSRAALPRRGQRIVSHLDQR